MKIPRQTIIFTENLEGKPIQVNADSSGDVLGTIAADISRELYSTTNYVNSEEVDKYPGNHWWAKDLEMFVPFIKGKVKGNGTDGGVKMFFIDTDTTVGANVVRAFERSNDFESPTRYRGDGANIKEYFGSDYGWLPQVDEEGSYSTISGNAFDYMIYSGLHADEVGSDPESPFYLSPCNPFSPPIYNRTIDGSTDTLRADAGTPSNVTNERVRHYGPIQYPNSGQYGQHEDWNPETNNTFKNFIDDDIAIPNVTELSDFYSTSHVNNISHNDRFRNAVIPYVRDFITQTDPYACGGYFHGGTVNTMQDAGDNEDIVNPVGAFGRAIQGDYPFNDNKMGIVFQQGVENFTDAVNRDNSYYGIVVTTAHLHNETVGDDQTDARWYLFLIKKSTVARFLSNDQAQYLILKGGEDLLKSNVAGIYNTKRERLIDSNKSEFRNVFRFIQKEDNFGKGDESDGWVSDDKRSPRSSIEGIVISFRKPNPTTNTDRESGRGNINELFYYGSYTIGPNSAQQIVLANEELFDQYRFVDNSFNQMSTVNYLSQVDFGLFSTPGINKQIFDTNFVPVAYTYNINEGEATINQIYYDDLSPNASKTGVPAIVGLSYDIFSNGIRLDRNTFTNVDGNFVDSNNIGFKFAILDKGLSDPLLEEDVISKLSSFANTNNVNRARRDGIYNFTDIFMEGDEGIEYGSTTVTYTEPGLKELTGVVFMYHLRDNNTIQPIKWWTTQSRLFLNYSTYFIEDFSEIGGPGFTLIPYPNTTPIISGLSKQSKYFRSLDDIVDADKFGPFEVTDRSRCNAAIRNDELGSYIGDSDIGQTRIFKKPIKIWEQLGVPHENNNFFYNDYEHYNGGGPDFTNQDRKYPQESPATEVFIDNTQYNNDCIVELNPGIQTFNMLRDNSGNENKGILLGDYKLAKDDEETPLAKRGTMKVARVSTQDRAY